MPSYRLKPKPIYSATLPDTWPKPIVAFKGSPGHLPEEAQPYVFVSRRVKPGRAWHDKVVPDMLYSIEANRHPVPSHEILEDEYRAFHNVIVNHLALGRVFRRTAQGESPTALLDFNSALYFDAAIWSGRLAEVKEQLPNLMAYNPGCPPPPGYMYQRFKQAKLANTRQPALAHKTRLTCPPQVLITGPFQNMVRLCTPNLCEKISDYDSAVIGRPLCSEIRIYNEPDAISTLAVDADFGRPISERARRVRGKLGMKPDVAHEEK